MAKYTDDTIKNLAAEIAKDFIENRNDMQKYMLMDVISALERGEDVDDTLLDMMLTRPLMEKFIDELLKHEEE